ncbi:putative RNA-polymerase beta-subunit [Yersinia phage phiR1-37]|uniref:RNA polymerase beta subunit n=1 Tax=Yersinia phage phiR1-37 TaxID=331278 RepID=UPI00022DBD0F|nr:RNA polymerase beta subunit [Yersinia phage phiR1-37]CCE26123.1 putative RNA-polymerase beta-subunit [Yersinia phage phiR1-37]
MAIINIDRVRPNKIYKVEKLLVNISKRKKPLCNILFNDNSVTSIERDFEMIRVIPNSTKKIFYPPIKINPNTMTTRKDSVGANDYYLELKNSRILFSRLKTIDLIESPKFSNKPVFADLSKYRESYNQYCANKKKTYVTGYMMFKNIIKSFISQLPKKVDYQLFLDLDEEPDFFINTFLYGLKKEPKVINDLFKGIDLVFFHQIGNLVYRPDLNDINKKTQIINLINKVIKLGKAIAQKQEVNDPDLEVVTKIDPKDQELYDQSLAYQHDEDEDDSESTDNEPDSKRFTATDDSTEDESEEKTNDDNSTDNDSVEDDKYTIGSSTDSEAPDLEIVDGALKDGDIDLDTVLNTSTVNAYTEKVREENEKFLNNNLKLQEAALKEFELEANKLAESNTLEDIRVNDDSIINPKVKSFRTSSITHSYYKKGFKKDIANIIKCLNNDPEHPVVVTKLEVTNVSNPLTKANEYHIEYMDKTFKRHQFRVNVPILSHDGFMLINGNKNFIAKQSIVLPVIKEANDRVQITTNYKKTFLYRKGDKINGQIDRVIRILVGKEIASITKKHGNSYESNLEFNISIPYNYLSRKLFAISLEGYDIRLNQKEIRETLANKKITIDYDKYIPIGFKGKTVILEEIATRNIVGYETGKKYEALSDNLTKFILDILTGSKDPEIQDALKSTKPSLSLSYTNMKIVSTSVALGVLVAAYRGLLPALDLYDIPYRIEEKRVAKTDSEVLLTFSDFYVFIDTKFDPAKELFANGLLFLNANEYKLEEATRMSPIFLDYFETHSGSRNTAKALVNFENSMIDPITLEILKELKMPTNFTELLLYGNNLLGDYQRDRKNDMYHFRIRDSEVIAVAFYNSLVDAFNNYKRSTGSGVPQTISVKRDDVIRRIQAMPNVEEYSTLNPIQEIEAKSKVTFKGPSGLNSEDSYIAENRAYSKTMLGLYGIFSPISAQIGVNRSMAFNPKIDTIRGYIREKDIKDFTADNLFSAAELVNGFTPKHADAPRAIMATTQNKHIINTKVQHPTLVGTGVDKALAHIIGQEFAWKAVKDGKITSIDEEKNLVFIEYIDGTTSAIDISMKAAKNSGGGFYIQNKLDLVNGIKVGSKFKAGKVIAYDKNFFKETLDGSICFAGGRLSKVAIMALPETFEDSAVVTDTLSKDLSSEVINKRDVILKANSRIIKMAQVGDEIEVNDALVIFEEVGNDEALAIAALEKLDKQTQASISELARSSAKAKYAGRIVDMKLYYNTPIEKMHPTLRKVVQSYIEKYDEKSSSLKNISPDEFIQTPSTEMIESNKLMGNEVQGVVIQYLIQHLDPLDVGDKITFFTSLKTIVANTVDTEKAPYSELHPEEEVSALLSPLSIISRMTMDFYLQGGANKVLIELKRQVLDILEE